jgi:hypothetical protein
LSVREKELLSFSQPLAQLLLRHIAAGDWGTHQAARQRGMAEQSGNTSHAGGLGDEVQMAVNQPQGLLNGVIANQDNVINYVLQVA